MQQILVNPIAAMAQGQEAAGQMSDMRRQNALRQLYEQQGAGIAQGDQNALAALARIDPMAAAELTQKRNALDIDRQNLDLRKDEFGLRQKSADFDEARLDMARKEAKRAATEHAAKMSAAERQQEITKITDGLKGAIRFYEAGDEQGYNQYIQSLGVSPEEAPFEQFPAVAAQYDGVLGALKEVQELGAGPKPADEYQRYVQEEQSAGRQPLGRIEYAQAKKGKGFSVTMADGTVVQVGGGNDGGSVQPSSPEAMVSTIDGILNDPALDTSTGIFSPLQSVPGTPQRRFGARSKQLEGQAFLQAFESLKGGGQITEIEGTKATQAIGRLDTAQSADDYRQALTELRDILGKAQQRPIGWAYNQKDPTLKQGNAPEVGVVEEGYRFLGGDPAKAESWEKVR